MRRKTLQEIVRKQPFRPFRIMCDNGISYDIRHPELAMVTSEDVIIGLPGPGDPEGDADFFAIVSLGHITGTEPLKVKQGKVAD
jgi:hypothetical protein